MRPRLGQHFLHERRIVEKIVQACAIRPGEGVFEIGAGPGVLTLTLAQSGARIWAIEIDDRLVRELRPVLPRNVELVQADVLSLNLQDFAQKQGQPLVVVGNLPYQISSPVLFWLLDALESWSRAVLMFQREVAARIVAQPGSKNCGVLSARLGAELAMKLLFPVAPGCFRPPPRIHSSVVSLAPLAKPRRQAPKETYAQVVRAAFATRRKTLRNALSHLLSAESLNALDIDPTRRGETLSIEEFDRIAQSLA